MAEHTPGPWRVSSRLQVRQVKSEKRLVADIITGYIPEAEANARFIAAAPDMEKALEMYIQAEDSELPSVEEFAWAGDAARAALAKARGE